MDKAYPNKRNWQNAPSTSSPLGATNLVAQDNALYEIDNRVVAMDTSKANQSTVNNTFNNVSLDEETGILTFTKVNNTTVTIDTKLEKIITNWHYDSASQSLILTLDDGTEQSVDLSALVTQYEFVNTPTISWTIEPDGKVKGNIINGSIGPDQLQPNYLADIIVQAQSAAASKTASEENANLSKRYAVGGVVIGDEVDNAKYYKEQTKILRDQAQAIVGVGVATESVIGLVKGDGNVSVDTDGSMWADQYKDKATVTGTSVQFTTADDSLIVLTSIKGASSQVVTVQGKQYFDKAKATAVKYIQPVTGTVNTSSFNNTASALIPVTAGSSYSISGHTYVQPNTPVGIAWYNSSGVYISGTSYQNATGNGSYTAPTGAVYARYTVNNVDLNTSQFELGSATAYASFIPNSPSIDYPSAIISASDAAFDMGACGKNLVKSALYLPVAQYITGVLGDIDLLPSTTYTISLIIPNGETHYTNENLFEGSNNDIIGDGTRKSITVITKPSVSKSNTLQYDVTYSKWRLLKNKLATTTSGNTNSLQLEKGSTATSYEPYKGNKLTILTAYPMRSIPDGTVFDEYSMVSDTSEKHSQRLGKFTLNGTEAYTLQATYTNTIRFTYTNSLIKVNTRVFSDKFIEGVAGTDVENIDGHAVTNNIQITILKSRLATQDVAGFKAFLASNPLTVIYELATPIETIVPNIYLTSYKGTTNVYTTANPQITFTAVAKSQLWANEYNINSKIGNLANLTTASNTDLVGAVNEVNTNIGGLSSLLTTIKTSIVGAVNEIVGKIGTLANLNTTNKSDVVSAINENTASLVNKAVKTDVENQFKSMGINVKYPPAPIAPPAYNGTTIDDATVVACVALALSAKLPLYFPTGTCRISSAGAIILNKNVSIFGDGAERSILTTTDNDLAFITYDCTNVDIYYPSVHDIGFYNTGTSPTSNSAAVKIIDGGNNHYFNFAKMYNINSNGCYDVIRSEKSANSSGENMINFGIYSNIVCTNTGSNNTINGINFMYGSGTGNIFTDNTFLCTGVGIKIGSGSGTINVGDIIISNSQFAVASRGIKLNGSTSGYTSNVTISNCQFDAGVDKSYEMINMNNFTIRGCIGTENQIITNCYGYSIKNHGSRNSEYYVDSYNVLVSEHRSIFKVILPVSYYSGCVVKVFSTGLVQGYGNANAETTFIICDNNSTTAAFTKFTENKIGAGTITHEVTISGNEAIFKVFTNGTSNNSVLKNMIEIKGYQYEIVLLDQFN